MLKSEPSGLITNFMGDGGSAAGADADVPKYKWDKCLKTFACWMQKKTVISRKKTCHYCNKNYIN